MTLVQARIAFGPSDHGDRVMEQHPHEAAYYWPDPAAYEEFLEILQEFARESERAGDHLEQRWRERG